MTRHPPPASVATALRRRGARLASALDAVLEAQAEALETAALLLCERVAAGGRVFTCGNGGSAAQAMHVEAELLARFRAPRRPLPALYLGASPATTTAIVNDYDGDRVFARPLSALAAPGDVLIALSTSGTSPNVVLALETARDLGVESILLTGRGGLGQPADVVLWCEGDTADAIQDVHHLLVHALMEALEDSLSGAPRA
jgi:D-sedoheptulose 7-phosphate isomerase